MTDNLPLEVGVGLAEDEARLRQRIREHLIVKPGASAGLAGRDPAWAGGPEFEGLSAKELKAAAKEYLERSVKQLAEAQEFLWASDTYALLVVFQAMDAAGKDSTIKHVMSGVNPHGVQVTSFKEPSAEERDHDFLWRIAKALPERGRIGIFNRSHYEEVVIARVHPELLEQENLPPGPRGGRLWKQRYKDINAFERHLDNDGTRVVKFFLNVSKEEQKQRFLARLEDPYRQWKFKPADVRERTHWDEYMQAYEDAITATSTKWAPWFVIPADRKPVMRAMVVGVLLDTIRSLDLKWPELSDADRAAAAEARRLLEAETRS
ncbi:MAG: polyphosphate kinase 2 family protein [Dehalococcoidia bacterium]